MYYNIRWGAEMISLLHNTLQSKSILAPTIPQFDPYPPPTTHTTPPIALQFLPATATLDRLLGKDLITST